LYWTGHDPSSDCLESCSAANLMREQGPVEDQSCVIKTS